MNKISKIFKRMSLPTAMMIVSFLAFVGIYYLMVATSVEPKYFEGLIFLVPSICFGATALLATKEKFKIVASPLITYIMSVFLGFMMLISLIFLSSDTATTITTDTGKYQRVLRLSDYPNNQLIKSFPSQIPSDAKNTMFHYNPAFLQGGENFDLKFETNSKTIEGYIGEFSQKAKWIGKLDDEKAGQNGVFEGTFGYVGYDDLPEDFTIYLIDSEPYHPNDWNHGDMTLVAISKQRNEIIFCSESW